MKKILIGDNSIALQKLIELNLSANVAEVLVAPDKKNFITAIKKYIAELVILDIDLPDNGAILIYKSLRSSRKFADVPVLLLVKDLKENDPRIAEFEDVNKVMSRPFETEDFINTITDFLDSSAQTDSKSTEALDNFLNTLDSDEDDGEGKEADLSDLSEPLQNSEQEEEHVSLEINSNIGSNVEQTKDDEDLADSLQNIEHIENDEVIQSADKSEDVILKKDKSPNEEKEYIDSSIDLSVEKWLKNIVDEKLDKILFEIVNRDELLIEIKDLTRELIEKKVENIVLDLAERLILNEIEKIKKES